MKRLTLMPAVVLSLSALLFTGVLSANAASATAVADPNTPWIVSMGDSYISGEGGRWAGNAYSESYHDRIDAGGPTAYFDNDAHTAERIVHCHRSSAADIHVGDGVNSLNLACSGSETTTEAKDDAGDFKPGLDFYDGPEGKGQALRLQEFAKDHKVKMVVVSIGGNDFAFGKIVTKCVTDYVESTAARKWHCKDDPFVKAQTSADNLAAVTKRIATAYKNINTAMRKAGYSDDSWTLVVQNYPSPIPPGGLFRYEDSWRNLWYTRITYCGGDFWDDDADYANQVILPSVNGAVDQAIKQSGLSNVKKFDVSTAFNGHRLCEKGTRDVWEDNEVPTWKAPGASDMTEWVNDVHLADNIKAIIPFAHFSAKPFSLQESLHPNYWGQLALRNCLRQVYNNGQPRSGVCVPGTGLNDKGEPNATLQ